MVTGILGIGIVELLILGAILLVGAGIVVGVAIAASNIRKK